MHNQIKAVVFDCFGVLATNGWLPFAREHFGHDSALLQQAHDLNKQKDAGFLSVTEFVEHIANLAGVSQQNVLHHINNNLPNTPLFEYIATLKTAYKIGFLSNAGSNRLPELFSPSQNALFDAVVLSCDLGVVKPDPKMYTTMCERLQVQPSETVFVDDIAYYVRGAEQVGMQGVVYNEADQAIREISALLTGANPDVDFFGGVAQ